VLASAIDLRSLTQIFRNSRGKLEKFSYTSFVDSHLRSIFRQIELEPSAANIQLLWSHYYRAGIPICHCSSVNCSHPGGLGCVTPGDPASHILAGNSVNMVFYREQALRTYCQACAVKAPLHTHGDVTEGGVVTDKYQCRCPLCQQMIDWARKQAIEYLVSIETYLAAIANLGELVDMSAAHSATTYGGAAVGIEELADSGIVMAIRLEILPLREIDAQILSTYFHTNVSMPRLPGSHGRFWLNIPIFDYSLLSQIPIIDVD
jgi:hypothetical protein